MAIAIGCDPVVSYAASAPLPGDIDEYLFAGFLRGERVEMVDCLTVPLQVPAHAQIVLEGYVEPGERAPEGPFGDHTGFYTPVEPFPVLHVECMTTQQRPGLPLDRHVEAAAGGRPDRPRHRAHLPAADQAAGAGHRGHVDAGAGVFHNCLIVSIRKRYPKHAQKVMNAVWGAHLLSLTKLIVVVDDDCDPSDYHEVAFRAFGNVDYAHDLLLTRARWTTWTTPRTSSSGAARPASTRPASCPPRATTRGWPEEAVMSPGDRGQGRPTLEGVRAVTARRRRPRARTGQGVPAAGRDRALGVRAAVRLPGRADRDDRRTAAGSTGPTCC